MLIQLLAAHDAMMSTRLRPWRVSNLMLGRGRGGGRGEEVAGVRGVERKKSWRLQGEGEEWQG